MSSLGIWHDGELFYFYTLVTLIFLVVLLLKPSSHPLSQANVVFIQKHKVIVMEIPIWKLWICPSGGICDTGDDGNNDDGDGDGLTFL